MILPPAFGCFFILLYDDITPATSLHALLRPMQAGNIERQAWRGVPVRKMIFTWFASRRDELPSAWKLWVVRSMRLRGVRRKSTPPCAHEKHARLLKKKNANNACIRMRLHHRGGSSPYNPERCRL